MSQFIQTINTADRLVAQWRTGAIPFICLCDRLALLGCYNITQSSFTYLSVTYPFRSV